MRADARYNGSIAAHSDSAKQMGAGAQRAGAHGLDTACHVRRSIARKERATARLPVARLLVERTPDRLGRVADLRRLEADGLAVCGSHLNHHVGIRRVALDEAEVTLQVAKTARAVHTHDELVAQPRQSGAVVVATAAVAGSAALLTQPKVDHAQLVRLALDLGRPPGAAEADEPVDRVHERRLVRDGGGVQQQLLALRNQMRYGLQSATARVMATNHPAESRCVRHLEQARGIRGEYALTGCA
eukprot:2914057-Pleurochrysis_carterae.AAC.3